MKMERLKLNLRAALQRPIRDIKNPEEWRKIRVVILRKVEAEAEKWKSLRVRSHELAREIFIC